MHGGGLSAATGRTAVRLVAALLVVAVVIAGCAARGSHSGTTPRTAALALVGAAAQPVPEAGASGGAALAAGGATPARKSSSNEPARAVRRQGTTSTSTSTSVTRSITTSAVPRSTAPAPATRSVRKREPMRHPSPPPATPGQSGHVVSCLTGAGLAHVSPDRGILWTGWDSQTGTFVYVEAYPTVPDAKAASNQLAPEEAGVAGRYVVHQAIVRYAGSPVPVVVGCLTGHPVRKGKPSKKPGAFTF